MCILGKTCTGDFLFESVCWELTSAFWDYSVLLDRPCVFQLAALGLSLYIFPAVVEQSAFYLEVTPRAPEAFTEATWSVF